jgi:hypothetical protein
MRNRFPAVFAYLGAALTLVIAILVPFVLMGVFTNAVAHAGLHVDENYTGGNVARVVDRNGYRILVYQPARPHFLQRTKPFVQIAFEPAAALPAEVDEAIDLDGDGRPDVRVRFKIPADAQTALHGDALALNSNFLSFENVSNDSFSRMVIRTGNRILVRVPMSR